MSRFLAAASLVLLSAALILWNLWRGERGERQRMESNQSALLTDVEFYKVASRMNAASVERLTLTVGEFERYFAEYRQTVEQMGIRLRRVESMTRTALEADYRVETVVRDSVVFRQRTDTLKIFDFRDPYLQLSGVVDGATFRGRITTYDTIEQVVHRVPRKFLFVSYGTKAIRQEIVTRNPHSRVTYSRYIKLGRKE